MNNNSNNTVKIANFQQFLDHFEGVKVKGDYAQVKCPSHDDKTASLSIKDTGKSILMFCHAGCDTETILKAVGLTYADMFYNNGHTPEAIYQYRNADGSFSHEKLKYRDPNNPKEKDFTQRSLDGTKIIYKAPNHIPYNYPGLIEAIKDNKTIIFPEGEKDAETARMLGYAYTTTGGASDWKDDWKDFFKGANIVLTPDRDSPGIKHMANVSKSLQTVCNSLKVVILPGDIKDLTDYVISGKGRADLDILIQTTPELVKEKELPPNTPRLKCLADVAAAQVTWLWYPYIPLGKLTIIEGDPGIGKSWIGLAIATALTTKAPLPGQNIAFDPYEKNKVILATAEDGMADTIRPRLDKMGADVNYIFFIDGLFTLDDTGINLVEGYLQDTLPALVLIDPLVAYLAGNVDIHKANQVRQVTAKLAALAEKYGTAIIGIRHLTKSPSVKAIYRGSGSIDFTASARSVLSVGKNDNGRGFVHIKSNLAPEGPAIGYDIKEDNFLWLKDCTLTKEEISNNNETTEGQKDIATKFLLEMLDGAGAIDSKTIINDAEVRGIKPATLYRAKDELGIACRPAGNQDGKRGRSGSTWELIRK